MASRIGVTARSFRLHTGGWRYDREQAVSAIGARRLFAFHHISVREASVGWTFTVGAELAISPGARTHQQGLAGLGRMPHEARRKTRRTGHAAGDDSFQLDPQNHLWWMMKTKPWRPRAY